jgi:peptide/nickel transport system permease protein
MIKPVFKKFRFLMAVLVGLVMFIFVLFQALPSADQILSAQRSDSATTAAIVKDLGLDQPTWKQGLYYLNDLSPVSIYAKSSNTENLTGYSISFSNYSLWVKFPYLRTSFQTKQKVSAMLIEAFWGTMVLAFAAILVSILIGIPLGVLAAKKQGTWIDNAIVWLSTVGISVPSFFSAMIFSWLFGFVLADYTHLPMTGSLWEIDSYGETKSLVFSNLILPAIALGIRPLAVFIQLTRNTMVEILGLDFIRTARAKGLNESVVIWGHAFPNALNPLITSIGGWFSSLLAGSFFTEYIFQWKGLGKVTIEALQQSDLPVVMGAVLFTACVFFVIHSFTELLYVWIDPRMKNE